MTDEPKRICLGVVTAPHGVKGAVRIKSFTEEPEDVARYGPLTDESGLRRFELRLTGAGKGVVIARLSGVEDRNQAEAVRGLRSTLLEADTGKHVQVLVVTSGSPSRNASTTFNFTPAP